MLEESRQRAPFLRRWPHARKGSRRGLSVPCRGNFPDLSPRQTLALGLSAVERPRSSGLVAVMLTLTETYVVSDLHPSSCVGVSRLTTRSCGLTSLGECRVTLEPQVIPTPLPSSRPTSGGEWAAVPPCPRTLTRSRLTAGGNNVKMNDVCGSDQGEGSITETGGMCQVPRQKYGNTAPPLRTH